MIAKPRSITAEQLAEFLSYCPRSGEFVWVRKPYKAKGVVVGEVAGIVRPDGYRWISYRRVYYAASRVAWLFIHGAWPTGVIDHINGIKTDNRISNLRDVSQSVNTQNLKTARAGSKTGFLGVRLTPSGRFCTSISHNKKNIPLGTFDSAEAASEVYLRAKRQLHEGCTI